MIRSMNFCLRRARILRTLCQRLCSSHACSRIPARVVTGYQGGEIKPIGNYLMVRQSDAHAWAEVWLSDSGWTRIDPTAAVSPDRIEKGVRSPMPETGLMSDLIGPEQLDFLRHLRLNWDAVNNQWNQWVLGYNVERQKSFLSGLGMPDVSWQNMAMALFWSSGAVVIAIALLMLYTRGKQHKDSALRRTSCSAQNSPSTVCIESRVKDRWILRSARRRRCPNRG
jgi:hypothetical protein